MCVIHFPCHAENPSRHPHFTLPIPPPSLLPFSRPLWLSPPTLWHVSCRRRRHGWVVAGGAATVGVGGRLRQMQICYGTQATPGRYPFMGGTPSRVPMGPLLLLLSICPHLSLISSPVLFAPLAAPRADLPSLPSRCLGRQLCHSPLPHCPLLPRLSPLILEQRIRRFCFVRFVFSPFLSSGGLCASASSPVIKFLSSFQFDYPFNVV